MSWFQQIIGGKGGPPAETNDAGGEEAAALVVATRPLKTMSLRTAPFVDVNGDPEMNINGSTGGTPDIVHNGIDLAKWTATAVSGTWVFDGVGFARGGIITIVDYSIIDAASDSITINGTERIAGTHWTAETSNAITAINLAADITANVPGVTASASGAVVTVTGTGGTNLATFTTNADSGEMTASAKGINFTGVKSDGEALFTRGSSLSTASYASLSIGIYLTSWRNGEHITIQPTLSGAHIGTAVNLDDYINTGNLNTWQYGTIPLGDMSLSGLLVDGILIRITNKSIDGYMDDIEFNETAGGSNVEYTVKASEGAWYHIELITLSFADEYNGSISDGTMPGLAYDQILGEAPENGFLFQRIEDGEVVSTAVVSGLGDLLQAPGIEISSHMDDGTDVFVAITMHLAHPITLKHDLDDSLRVLIRDNLSGLKHFRQYTSGREEVRL